MCHRISGVYASGFLGLLTGSTAWAGPNENLMAEAGLGNVSGVKEALRVGADVNAQANDGNTTIIATRTKNHPEIASMIDPSLRVQNFPQAVRNDDLSGVQDALSSGGDPNTMSNSEGETSLLDAVNRGYADIVMALFSHGAEVISAEQAKLENMANDMEREILKHLGTQMGSGGESR